MIIAITCYYKFYLRILSKIMLKRNECICRKIKRNGNRQWKKARKKEGRKERAKRATKRRRLKWKLRLKWWYNGSRDRKLITRKSQSNYGVYASVSTEEEEELQILFLQRIVITSNHWFDFVNFMFNYAKVRVVSVLRYQFKLSFAS